MSGVDPVVKEVVAPQLKDLVASAKSTAPADWTKKRRQEALDTV